MPWEDVRNVGDSEKQTKKSITLDGIADARAEVELEEFPSLLKLKECVYQTHGFAKARRNRNFGRVQRARNWTGADQAGGRRNMRQQTTEVAGPSRPSIFVPSADLALARYLRPVLAPKIETQRSRQKATYSVSVNPSFIAKEPLDGRMCSWNTG